MRAGKAQIDCNGATIDAEIVPLNAFYSVQLDPVEAVTVNNLAQLSGNAALVGGDYRVLVAMHITSKEIANWTWALRAGSGACGVGIGARVSGGSCKRRLADARARRKTCARGRGQDAE